MMPDYKNNDHPRISIVTSHRNLLYFLIVTGQGTRRLSSSVQFCTSIISVTGEGFISSRLTIKNRCPSREIS
jgi:hypothetical protein